MNGWNVDRIASYDDLVYKLLDDFACSLTRIRETPSRRVTRRQFSDDNSSRIPIRSSIGFGRLGWCTPKSSRILQDPPYSPPYTDRRLHQLANTVFRDGCGNLLPVLRAPGQGFREMHRLLRLDLGRHRRLVFVHN